MFSAWVSYTMSWLFAADESAVCIKWPKYWSFSFSISPSNEYSGLISRLTDLIFYGTLESSSSATQFESINSLVLSLFHCPALKSIHDYWKNHSFVYTDQCWQSNFSASSNTVQVCHNFSSKEQVPFNFMVAVICSDFGVQKNSLSMFPLFPHLFAMK